MNTWNHIYSAFNPIAFSIFGFKVHWYGLMYILALLSALFLAKYFNKKYKFGFSNQLIDNYFFWVELGIILSARIGFLLVYTKHPSYYLLHPLQIFNPFVNGKFEGISGMSYHGGVVGFLLASALFFKIYKVNILKLLDLAALSIPLGYFFGRIGNFLNQELVGRETTSSFGIYVDGILRHPSQLYEAFFEGIVIFFILIFYRKYQKKQGELIALYGMLYPIMRFFCEFFRQPDSNIGFLTLGLSMGQLLSFLMFFVGLSLMLYVKFFSKEKVTKNSKVNSKKKS